MEKYLLLIVLTVKISFCLAQRFSSFNDPRDGRVYKTVKIGEQVWMAENLDVSTFRNGDPIPQAKSNEEWIRAMENKQPAWCYYNNDTANGVKYGKLYNWYAVNDPRGLAPVGYNIPSDAEWTKLVDYLGGSENAGAKMKSKQGWAQDGNGINSSGFSGLPGGNRGYRGAFAYIGTNGRWWSSTEDGSYTACSRSLSFTSGDERRFSDFYKGEGMSVRCLSDNESASTNDVNIGTQVWMTKNLNVSTFRNGDPIPQAKTGYEWKEAGENKRPAWCYYNNDPANGIKYGKLYNWYAVNDPRGLAPAGYHIPSVAEWIKLVDYLGGREKAAPKMKSKQGWAEDFNGTNSSGFSGLPGGNRSSNGTIYDSGGFWWSSSESGSSTACSRVLVSYYSSLGIHFNKKEEGLSVRCLRD